MERRRSHGVHGGPQATHRCCYAHVDVVDETLRVTSGSANPPVYVLMFMLLTKCRNVWAMSTSFLIRRWGAVAAAAREHTNAAEVEYGSALRSLPRYR